MRVPGGGAFCLGLRRPGSGALPPPTARPLGGLPGPTTHWLWVRGGAGVGARHRPHSARSCELALRAVRAARGRPGGGASCLGVGRPGSGALPLPTARPLGGLPGPTTHSLWVRGGAGVGTQNQPNSAHSCVLSGWHEGARGGRLLPGSEPSGVRRSPTPDCPPSGRAAGAVYPPAVGAGGCGRGDPSPTPQRALLRAGCARCGGATRAPGGGASCLGVGVRGRALSHPRLPALWAGCRGPLPTGYGCGGVGAWGPVTNPTARALASWLCALCRRHEGARGGRLLPGCGASGVGRSPTPDCPPSGRAAGAHYALAAGAGGVRAWGPVTNPTARALASWLCALWGRHEGARGGRLLLGCGASGVGRSPTPDCPPSERAAGAHYPLAVGAGGCGRGDPSPTPQRALLRAGFACCGGVTRTPGGGASCLGVGRPGSGALQPSISRPLGGLPGPTTHWLWVQGGAGVGTCHQPHSARSCMLWGRHEGARGGRLLPGCGASRVGRSPIPDCPPSGRAAGAHYPLAVGAGGCGRGDPSPTLQRTLLRAGFARCGGGTRAPGGGAPCLGVGRPVSGALPPPTARPLGGLPGPTTHWLRVRGGCGRGDPSPTPQRALLRAVAVA